MDVSPAYFVQNARFKSAKTLANLKWTTHVNYSYLMSNTGIIVRTVVRKARTVQKLTVVVSPDRR